MNPKSCSQVANPLFAVTIRVKTAPLRQFRALMLGIIIVAGGILLSTPNVAHAATSAYDSTMPTYVSIDNVTKAEGNSGQTDFVFPVTLINANPSQSYSVGYYTLGSNADSNDFMESPNGTLIFATGVTSQTITIKVNGDTTVEPNETFNVFLNTSNVTCLPQRQGTDQPSALSSTMTLPRLSPALRRRAARWALRLLSAAPASAGATDVKFGAASRHRLHPSLPRSATTHLLRQCPLALRRAKSASQRQTAPPSARMISPSSKRRR